MKVDSKSSVNPSSKAKATVAIEVTDEKNEQLVRAVAWTREDNVWWHSAVKSGLYPLVSTREWKAVGKMWHFKECLGSFGKIKINTLSFHLILTTEYWQPNQNWLTC